MTTIPTNDTELFALMRQDLFTAVVGDVLFGDIDGVLVILGAHLRESIAAALEKVHGENKVAAAIRAGLTAQGAWDQFGIM